MASSTKGGALPKAYRDFTQHYPKLGDAWESARKAEKEGPLDEKTSRLVKLGVSIGAFREGAVHSAARKALAAGASPREVRHVVALAASTIGFPSTVAAYSWLREEVGGGGTRRRG
jgi:4-carboxymuconolactone decarboxylase